MNILNSHACWRRWLLAGLAAAAGTAGAVDIVATPPAQPLPDHQITIGSRSVMLPPGNWTYVARSEGTVKHGSVDRKAPYHTAYAMAVDQGRMVGGVTVRMTINSTPVTAWVDEPCKVEGYLHKEEFDGSFKFPECLVVYKRRAHLAAKQEGFYGQVQEWASAQPVKLPGPVYEVVYSRFGTNDFGVVRVFVPQRSVANDGELIAWAKQLPPAFKSLFENRQSVAGLPALPVRSH
jgi:hypothetical protein